MIYSSKGRSLCMRSLTHKVLHWYSHTKITCSHNYLIQNLVTYSWERSLHYSEILYKLEVIVWLGEALFYSANEPFRPWMGRKGSYNGEGGHLAIFFLPHLCTQ